MVLNGVLIPGATGQVHTSTNSGWYWDVVSQGGCKLDTSNNLYLVMTATGEHNGARLSVSPVPNDGIIGVQINFPGESSCRLSAYNSSGIMVFRKDYTLPGGSASVTIDLRAFTPGIYTIEAGNNNTRIVRKVLLNK